MQQPYPPIWIGGSGPKRTLRITARYADVWNAAGGSPEEVAASSAILDQHCADVGRDPGQIRRSVQVGVGEEDLGQARATVEGYVRVGVTDFLLIVHGENPVAIGEQVAAHLPRLRDLGCRSFSAHKCRPEHQDAESGELLARPTGVGLGEVGLTGCR